MDTKTKAPRRIAQAILNSLKGGVVPRIGLPYVTVGRKNEIDALLHDIEIIGEGGASFRFLMGRYGSGKSFLLQTIRNYAMDRNFVVADADLSPERRLTGTRGQGLATYRELIGNLSTKTRPEGGALMLVLDRWISSIQTKTAAETGLAADSPAFSEAVRREIYTVLGSMSELVHGYDFARLLSKYYEAAISGDDAAKARILRWFRGEYQTKTEARQELGVGVIITDDDWYEYLKLFAAFFRQAGYLGMLVLVDELVNIYKIPNSVARNSNYEKILTIYNDALQGKARYIGFLMSGTPQCIEDRRRGVYSYEALSSRLAEGKFSRAGARDLLSPVIRLEPLTPEEMLVLTEKLTALHAGLYGYESALTEEDLAAFLRIEFARVGADTKITPREIIRDFIELLDILYQHPGMQAETLLNSEEFSYAKSDAVSDEADLPFAEFTV